MNAYMNVSLIFIAATSLLIEARAATSLPADKKPTVFVTTAKLEDFSDVLQYPGRIRSKINAWMVSESPGQIQSILKPVGSKVKKGDVVLIIKNSDPVYKYAPVKIYSPADGFITNLEVDLLTRVDRGDKLFSVTDPNNLVIETEIPAADLHFFQIGQTAVLKDASQKDYNVKIHSLSPAVDIRTGTASAILHLADTAAVQLHQGQVGQVIFKVNSRKSFLLPESALISKGGSTFIRVMNGSKTKMYPIHVSQDLGDKIEIQEGLNDGDQVVTRWNRFISDGEDVDVQSPSKVQ